MPLLEIAEAIQEVAEDLAGGFGGIFDGTDELRPVGVFGDVAVGSDSVSVLAWEWKVRHVGSLQGTPATGRELTLRGVTVIERLDGELLFSRHIDWLGLYAELGAVTIARPPVTSRAVVPSNVPFPDPPES